MRLLIGAPVLRREWIADRYMRAAIDSADAANVEFSFAFLGGADDPTWDVFASFEDEVDVRRVYIDEPRTSDIRDWQPRRFERMAQLRNRLLQFVRLDEPDAFLSLDTDILLAKEAVSNLAETLRKGDFGAVGGYCYLKERGTSCPSYAHLPTPHFLHRPDCVGSVLRCDVLMAIKLMGPAAYAVDYCTHPQGEDTGWSLACRKAGVKLAVDARVVNKHIMNRAFLDRPDPRCGY